MGCGDGGGVGCAVGDRVGCGVGLGVGAGVGNGVGFGVGGGVGPTTGAGVGCGVGAGVGPDVGFGVGGGVGPTTGAEVGCRVGLRVGPLVGLGDGSAVGSGVCPTVGTLVGLLVGVMVGYAVGSTLGVKDGMGVGLSVGSVATTSVSSIRSTSAANCNPFVHSMELKESPTREYNAKFRTESFNKRLKDTTIWKDNPEESCNITVSIRPLLTTYFSTWSFLALADPRMKADWELSSSNRSLCKSEQPASLGIKRRWSWTLRSSKIVPISVSRERSISMKRAKFLVSRSS